MRPQQPSFAKLWPARSERECAIDALPRLSTFDFRPSTFRRRAYTLAEMLIVMTIMIMLVAVALPTIKHVMEDGKLREASRQFNAFLAMAKARALQTGRPCGVIMLCDLPLGVTDPPANVTAQPPQYQWPARMVTRMFLAEVPPPYSGGILGARGRIMFSVQGLGTPCFYPLAGGAPDGTPLAPTGEFATIASLLQPDELFLVRFDYKGAWYLCQYTSPSSAGALREFVYLGVTSAGFPTPIPPGYGSNGLPLPSYVGNTYQIVRMPRRIGNPLELPAGTCLDLAYSGIGPTDLPMNSNHYGMYPDPTLITPSELQRLFPIRPTGTSPPLQTMAVMFTPGGGIDSLYLNNYFFTPPTTVHFLVGRTEKVSLPSSTGATGMPAMFERDTSNIIDPQTLWVSIARGTGTVTTSDNMPPPVLAATPASMSINGYPTALSPFSPIDQATFISFCRRLATNREQATSQ